MRAPAWIVPLASAAALLCGPPSARAASADGPDYEMPFPCGDSWTGTSRYSHSPSPLAIDWNRPDDLGALVVAAAPGVVTRVADLGDRSYGRFVVVDHGNGTSTLYAHLLSIWTTQGEAVDQGTILGRVGSSGGSTGPHLHFEERLDGRDQAQYFHRTPFTMGSTLASLDCPDAPVRGGDWNGDGTDEPAVFRRTVTPRFILRRTGTAPLRIPWGRRTDEPVTGDWNGDGAADVGVRRPGLRSFLLRAPDGSAIEVVLGRVRDVGVAGDWNGDGTTEVGVWNPGTCVFTLRSADGAIRTVALGSPGDRPVTGDWNRDGLTDVGVYTASTGTFTLRSTTRAGVTATRTVRLGGWADLPVTGDWDGNGSTDVGVWSPSTATYQLLTTATATRPATLRTTRMGVPRG